MILTIREALHRASSLLEGKSSTPGLDGRVLLSHVLARDAVFLYTYPERTLTPAEAGRYMAALKRRRRGEPVAYILGEKEFMGLPFQVSPAVLIPRPETEILVEEAFRVLTKSLPPQTSPEILDVGTGSGAIAISLAHILPPAQVTAVDTAAGALEVARKNAHRIGVADRVKFLQGDLFNPLSPSARFHLILSNPPYIPSGEMANLPVDVGDYEPASALDGGEDGLSFYRRLLPAAFHLLHPGGIVAVEVGFGQAKWVASLGPPEKKPKIIEDYAGIERVVLWSNLSCR